MNNLEAEGSDPFVFFNGWYLNIFNKDKENSNAVVLSTASSAGRVSSRVVLLKEYNSKGFVFFTGYNSRKGKQLAENIYASMLFYWPEAGRQVRIEGAVEKVAEAESEAYFNSRNKGHRINAIVSDQSKPIENIEKYIEKRESAYRYYSDKDPVRPSDWGGYRLVPDRFEFWEEGKDRFHTRIEYLYEEEKWSTRRLQP